MLGFPNINSKPIAMSALPLRDGRMNQDTQIFTHQFHYFEKDLRYCFNMLHS